ncbi:MAG: class I SAM-dependent methyltransferase [Ilumatobacteraceae bacterium]
MTLRFHEIAETRHRILNALSADKLRLIGEICAGPRPTRILDLCCGKAEMLCTWAVAHHVTGVGVDISEVFLAAGRRRAAELEVSDRIELVHADAAAYVVDETRQFDMVSCIGATWIGDGLAGTLDLMRPRVAPDGLVVVGEPYWVEPLPDGLVVHDLGVEIASLPGTLDIVKAAGFDLVEMVLANADDWDRYVAAQWMAVADWLIENPDDPDATDIREWITAGQRSFLEVERRYLGWGVFVLRAHP